VRSGRDTNGGSPDWAVSSDLPEHALSPTAAAAAVPVRCNNCRRDNLTDIGSRWP